MRSAVAAGVYVRISDDRAGDAAGVARQERDARALADRHGWRVTEVYVENDTSAFKRRKVRLPDGSTALRVDRPAFRRMLNDLGTGAIGAVVAYDLDRVARDPRDLEDLIDVVETRKVPTAAVTGSLDLTSDNGVTMARIAVAIANKSSRDTARRVARKHLELAEQGRVGGGGIRSYGYARDGVTIIDDEAAVIREMAQRIIDGDSLSSIARDLTQRAVPTVQGGREWSARSVHSVVSKARNAALREYKGEIIGPAAWPAIFDRETWEQVRGALAQRARGSANTLTHWLTGVLICSACGNGLAGRTVGRGARALNRVPRTGYWCAPRRGGCGSIGIDAPNTEAVVSSMIVSYLQRPDVLADLAASTSHESARSARASAASDEAQLGELAALWGDRKISTAEYLAARSPIEERLRAARGVMRAATPHGVRALLSATDVQRAWDHMTSAHDRRDVARLVFPRGIVVHPGRESTRFQFDPTRLVPATDGDIPTE